MEFKDYYAALGVKKNASATAIKRAYRKLARTHHPDVNPGDPKAEQRFKEINEAYEVLGDPEKRRKYDELGANWRLYEQGGGGASPFASGSPFGAQWSAGGRGGVHTMSPEEAEDLFGFSDFFQEFFSGGGPRGASRPPVARRGRDVEHQIALTLEEAYAGTTRRLSLTAGDRTRRVEVKIPAGVDDGSRVRVAGEGEPGAAGAEPGDLFCECARARMRPSPGVVKTCTLVWRSRLRRRRSVEACRCRGYKGRR